MDAVSPVRLMIVGGSLLLASWLVVLALTIRLLAPNFLVVFLAFSGSVAGLAMGVLGAATYIQQARRR